MRDAMIWVPINRYTRAGAYGKKIKCPKCGGVHHVYHFSWIASVCSSCGEWVNKLDYTVQAKAKNIKPKEVST